MIDANGSILAIAKTRLKRIHPNPGWVEQDPLEIWNSVITSVKEVLTKFKDKAQLVKGVGIADQGETIILWDKQTGTPVYNAIVWQDRRTAGMLSKLLSQYPDLEKEIRQRTGLMLDPYFSASKISWILQNVEKAREKIKQGRLLIGTTDTWIVWMLTRGKLFVTDYTTASRTMLLNIHTLRWDEVLLDTFGVPADALPEIIQNAQPICCIDDKLFGFNSPISNIMVDQQAALFGHMCFVKGDVKATYGTGAFVLMNIGSSPIISSSGFLTTIAWVLNNTPTYALDGGVYHAGALIDYLIENLKIIKDPDEADRIASETMSNEGVYFVPALAGLSAPYWDTNARGVIIGLNPSSSYKHIVRAALEGIAYSVYDIITGMSNEINEKLKYLKVDGGLSQSNFLMQFQADILGVPIIVPENKELTGLGTGLLAGMGVEFFPQNLSEIEKMYRIERIYKPRINSNIREQLIKMWRKAVARSKGWIEQ